MDLPNLNLDASGNILLPNADQLISLLPPGIAGLGTSAVQSMQSVMGKVGQAQPAIDMVSHIASGGTPDPQEIVGALAATAAIANPIAGAIVGTAGELAIGIEKLAEGVLDALGLIDHPPPTFPYIGFIKKGDSIPRNINDPNWKTWDYWMIMQNGQWRWLGLPMNPESLSRERAIRQLISNMGTYPSQAPNLKFTGPVAQNSFEDFFFKMLKKNLENWMNMAPSMSPRDLLAATVSIWNHLHLPGNSRVYSADALPGDSRVFNYSVGIHPVELILSAAGDTSANAIQGFATSVDPITVNMGNLIVPAPKVVYAPKDYTLPTMRSASGRNIVTTENLTFSQYFQAAKAKGMNDEDAIAQASKDVLAAQAKPNVIAQQTYKAAIKQGAPPQQAKVYAQTAATHASKANQTQATKTHSLLGALAGATAGFFVFNIPGALAGGLLGFFTGKKL